LQEAWEKLNFVAQGKEQQVLRKFNNHWKFRSMALSQESQRRAQLDLFEIKRQPQIFDLVLASFGQYRVGEDGI